MDCNSRKSRGTWNNRKVWPWSTKWSRADQENFFQKTHWLEQTSFQQPKRRLYTWTLPGGQYWNQFIYDLCSQIRCSIQSVKIRPGVDCGSDHNLLVAKLKLTLKQVWKTTMPFRYDLNQIPFDYTVGVMNRFKGLYLVDRVSKDYRWSFITLYRKEWPKSSWRKKKMQEGQVVVWKGFTNSWGKTGFPGGASGKESACNSGDVHLIHWWGRSPRGGNGNPPQYSCLKNPMDRGACQVIVHGVTKSQTQLSMHACMEERETKSKGQRKRYTQLHTEFQRIARRDKKVFLNEQCKE